MSAPTSLPSVPIEEILNPPYVSVLCYPTPSDADASARLTELKSLGVSKLVFEGKTKLGYLGLLGKGCVSLVVKAEREGQLIALKIRRIDANRPTLEDEARLTKLANQVGVGPSLISYSKNFILMELVQGVRIVDWLKDLSGKGMMKKLRMVLKETLDQCRRLDKAGIDHGELSTLTKHVIVSNKVSIIDFETASLHRRLANVTSAVQYLFIGGPGAKKVRRLLNIPDTNRTIEAVRAYKSKFDEESFTNLLRVLKMVNLKIPQ